MKIRTIRSTLIQAFSLVIVLSIVVLGVFSLFIFQRTLVNNSLDSTQQLIAQLNRVLDSYISYMDDIALVVLGNGDTRELMADSRPRRDLESRVSRLLESIRTVRRDIDSIFLFADDTRVLSSDPERRVNPFLSARRLGWFLPLKEPGAQSVISAARVENLFADRYSWVVSLVRGDKRRGRVQVNLNYAIINDLCRAVQLGATGYIFIINAKGEIVYHPRQQLIYSGIRSEPIDRILELRNGSVPLHIKGRDAFYSTVTSDQTGWTVVAVTYLDEIFYNSRDIEYFYLMIAIGSFLLAVVFAWGVSRKVSLPIEELRSIMQRVETGNFDLEITVHANNEIYELARDCDIAIKKIRDLLAQNQREQEIKRKQDLLMLQSQINPHFLYNTLDSIIWLVELGKYPEAIEMTVSLARFFRFGISKGSEIISVGDEIEHIRCYLTIQKMRYQSKLEFSLDIQPGVSSCRCLKLLLQPLVENAIYHGIKNRESGGVIRVEGYCLEDTVVLRIHDNGIGMDAAMIHALSLPEPDLPGSPVVHIGVRNVQERIRLYFGEPFGLHFASAPGEGTVVTIILPRFGEGGSE